MLAPTFTAPTSTNRRTLHAESRGGHVLRDMLREIPNSLRGLTVGTTQPRNDAFSASEIMTTLRRGDLGGNKRLMRDLFVLVISDEHEVIVSEPQFHVYGYGSTRRDALADLQHVLVDTYELLEEDEAVLDPYLTGQLAYLRSMIQPSL